MLLMPLHGAFLAIFFAILLIKVFALIDVLGRAEAGFVSTGKQSKQFWVVVLVLALLSTFVGFLSIVGLVAALVYILDVRPALTGT